MKEDGDIGLHNNDVAWDRDDEHYKVLCSCPHYRIGFGSRTAADGRTSPFIEIVIMLFPDDRRVDLSLFERDIKLLKELGMRGYALRYHNDDCITAEKCISSDRLMPEYIEAVDMISDILALE